MNESLATILHDHYKDTFGHIRDRERERDRLFLIVFTMLGVVLLQLQYTLLFQQTVSDISVLGVSIDPTEIPTAVLLSTSWTFLAALLMRYYNVSIHIEKQFDYLHTVESKLCDALGEKGCISRESSGYLTEKFSAFRHAVWIFFTVLFPMIVIAAVWYAMSVEWKKTQLPVAHQIFDSVLAFASICSVVLFTFGCWSGKIRKWFQKG